MRLERSLLMATLVSAAALAGVAAVSAQPAGDREVHALTRCTKDFARCEESISAAAQLVPDSTRGFLAYCAEHFQACEDRIIMIDRRNSLSATRRCLVGVREPARLPETAKRILAWLGQRPELAEQKTDDSVTAAVAALWPC